jgi:hypothetical protein
MTTTPKITVDPVGGWPTVSGTRVVIALDPEDRRVYDYYVIGSGAPEAVWHRRHMSLASVPVDTVADSLQEWLEMDEQRKTIEAIIEGYEGTHWTGSNHVGRWSEEAEDAAQEFEEACRSAISQNEIAQYVDAREWLWNCLTVSDVLNEIEDDDLDTYVETQVEEAKGEGVYLDEDVLRKTIRDCAKDSLDTYDEEMEDGGVSAELTAGEAIIARRILAD